MTRLVRRMSGKGHVRGTSDGGAALVEAALVLPILLLLTFGIWTTARAWNVNNTLDHAAREAARFGATIDPWDSNPGGSIAAVNGVADADLSASAINPSLVGSCIELVADGGSPGCELAHTNNTGTDQVFVKVTYPDFPLNFLFFSVTVDLEGTAVSRFEAS